MNARLSISICCFAGALVLLVSTVLNMSASKPNYTVTWIEGIIAVLLAGAGFVIRRERL